MQILLRPLCIGLLLCFAASLWAEVHCIRQGDSVLSSRDIRRIERVLIRSFPTNVLRKRALGKGKTVVTRVVYFPLKQRSRQYVLAITTAKWTDYASRFAIYRIYRDSIVRIYTSRSWQANYPVYRFDYVATEKEQFILFAEGTGDHERHELASIFSFGQYNGKTYIRDLTPSMQGVTVKVGFPFRPLYAKDISLTVSTNAVLTASDNFAPTSRWQFDRTKRKFIADLPATISTSVEK